MTSLRRASVLALLIGLCTLDVRAAVADDTDTSGSLHGAGVERRESSTTVEDERESATAVTLRPVCARGAAVCTSTCQDKAGNGKGVRYTVVVNGKPDGEVCVMPSDSLLRTVLTPDRVWRAFKAMTWPASKLIIQPPHGKTLVNFKTNFLTTNTHPTSQSVTLLGQRVTIEATPSSYTWHWGDQTDSTTTSKPGRRYPHLDITHAYLHKGDYQPSVDTTYTGRFRVNGGTWQTIPGTLTVDGDTVDLTVIGAKPTLVGSGYDD